MVESLNIHDLGQKPPETSLEDPNKLNEEWNTLQDHLELIQRQMPYLRVVLKDYGRLNIGLDPKANEDHIDIYRKKLVELGDEGQYKDTELLESLIRNGEEFLQNLPKERESLVLEIKKNLTEAGLSPELNELACKTLISDYENERIILLKRIAEIENYFLEFRKRRVNVSGIKQKSAGPDVQKGKHLGYALEFKEEIKRYPKVLSTVLSLMKSDKLKKPSNYTEVSSAHENGVRIIFLDRKYPSRRGIERQGIGKLFKVTFPDLSSYFAKVHDHQEAMNFFGGGYQQFSDSAFARSALKELSFVEVIDFQLGYQDEKKAFFVAKWRDGISSSYSFDSYIILLMAQGKKEKAEELERKRDLLIQKLTGLRQDLASFSDDPRNNWGFDIKTEKFAVFDMGGRGPFGYPKFS